MTTKVLHHIYADNSSQQVNLVVVALTHTRSIGRGNSLPRALYRIQALQRGCCIATSTFRTMTASRSSSPFGGVNSGSTSSGIDHKSSHRFRLSQKEYPEDCPPYTVRWHYAVDVRICHNYDEDNANL